MKRFQPSKNLWGYDIEQGGWGAAAGTVPQKTIPADASYAKRCRVGEIVAIPSRTLSLTCNTGIKINYVWVDADGYSLGGSGYQMNGDTTTAPENAVSMTFILAKINDSDCTPSNFTNIMLVAGDTPLPYEPYGNTWQTKSPPKYINGTWVDSNPKERTGGEWV